jgi:hypothetical protein
LTAQGLPAKIPEKVTPLYRIFPYF